MPGQRFSPGFRLSLLDIGVLLVGALLAAFSATADRVIAFIIAFVLAHFFLFCNVFRVARPLELAWAAWFVLLAGATLIASIPGWFVAIPASLAATVAVIAFEMRKPSYHGVGWQRINPKLREWWEANSAR
jgi:hypothetical protein